jgi:hypothetical protein
VERAVRDREPCDRDEHGSRHSPSLPQSPVLSAFGTAGIIGTSQMNPGDLLADLILGPKGTNYKDIGLTEPPWFEVGD